MRLRLLVILCCLSASTEAKDCYYGNDKLFARNLADLKNLSNFQQSATAVPYSSYHYNGYSVSAEQYERLMIRDKAARQKVVMP